MRLAIGVLLLVALGRWIDAGPVRTVSVEGTTAPTALLVVQEGDCADRRGALERWLAAALDASSADPGSIRLVVLRGPDPRGASAAAPVPVLDRRYNRSVTRALLRAGVSETPALLIVDSDGRPVMASTFDAAGPGERAELVHRMLRSAGASGASPDADFPPDSPERGVDEHWNP